MTTTNQNLTMYSGDSKTINVSVDMAGTLAGSSVIWSAGQDYVVDITKTTGAGITITGDKTFTVALVPSDTASLEGYYMHEAQVTDLDSNVHTVLTGRMRIIKDLIV